MIEIHRDEESLTKSTEAALQAEQHLTNLMLGFTVICHPSVYQDSVNVLEI